MSAVEDFTPLPAPRRLFRFATASGQSLLACVLVAFVVGLGLLSLAGYLTDTTITTFDPLEMNVSARMQGPSGAHWMGTDKIGRDMLARVVADEALMRLTDLFPAFPALILAAAIAASFGGGLIPSTIALAAGFWPCYARLIRARVLSMKQLDYVAAARAMGASHLRLIFVTLLPMVWPLVIVQATTDVGFVTCRPRACRFRALAHNRPPRNGA